MLLRDLASCLTSPTNNANKESLNVPTTSSRVNDNEPSIQNFKKPVMS